MIRAVVAARLFRASYWSGTVVQCTVEKCGFTFLSIGGLCILQGWNDGSRCNRFDVEPSWGMREKSKNPYYKKVYEPITRTDQSKQSRGAKDEVDWLAVADVSDINLLLPFDASFCDRCGEERRA